MMKYRISMIVGIAMTALLSAPERAEALSFVPTDAEWVQWPEYCRARYVVSNKGRTSGYRREMPEDLVQHWERQMGPNAWYGLHHHCAGLAYFERGKAQTSKLRRDSDMEAAVRNHEYMLGRLPASDPMYPEVVMRMALVYREWGQAGKAMTLLEQVIKAQPSSAVAYLAKAKILKDEGRRDAAREALLAGDTATNGRSAEIKYALGVDYLNTGQYDRAREFGARAYALGYPLPWLRDQLRVKGYPIG